MGDVAVALEDIVWAIGDVETEGSPEALSDRTTTRALEMETKSSTSSTFSAALLVTDSRVPAGRIRVSPLVGTGSFSRPR